jgi:hypothetical protein
MGYFDKYFKRLKAKHRPAKFGHNAVQDASIVKGHCFFIVQIIDCFRNRAGKVYNIVSRVSVRWVSKAK